MKTRKVFVHLRKKQWETAPDQTVRQILRARGLDPERYLLILNGKIVDEQVIVRAGDHLRLAVMISGGTG